MSTPDELRAQAAFLEAKAAELETPLTKEDVSHMYANKDYESIEQARRAGRLDALFAPAQGNPEGN
jgi:hypothetical protein